MLHPDRGATDALLGVVAAQLQAAGVALAGAVQSNAGGDDPRCDMDLRLLPDGLVIRISQSLGPGSTGCRLDAGALETAVGLVEPRLAAAELLIVNKFGKHEAEGRGFRALVAEALAQGMPVLIGVNAANLVAFEEFSGGLAQPLAPDVGALVGWCLMYHLKNVV